MPLDDKDVPSIRRTTQESPAAGGLDASSIHEEADQTSRKPGSKQHLSKSDPISLARQEIAEHEQAASNRSLLGKAISAFYTSDEGTLSKLKQESVSFDQAVNTGDEKAAQKIRQEIGEQLKADQAASQRKEDIAHLGSSILKTAALFAPGGWGRVGAMAFYSADQINPLDRQHWVADGLLGMGKGAAMRSVFEFTDGMSMGAVNKGITLGLGSRLSDVALTRQTWEGGFSSGTGKLVHDVANRESIATDAAVFGLAHGLGFAGEKAGLGGLSRFQTASSMFAAGTFGLLSGSISEVNRQKDQESKSFGSFDYSKIVRAGLLEGGVNAIAGATGGLGTHAGTGEQVRATSLAFTDVSLKLGADGTMLHAHPASAVEGRLDAVADKAGNIIDSATGLPKLWWAERDIYKLNNEERAELLQHIHTELMHENHINDFSRGVLRVADRWDDVSGQEKQETRSRYEAAVAHVQNMVNDETIPIHLIGRMHEHEEVQAALSDNHAALSKYRDYVQARETYADVTSRLNTILNTRVNDLQQVMDTFVDSRSLPRVNIKHSEDLGSAAANYNIGHGYMTVRDADLLSAKTATDLVGHMYHELVHSEQDFLVTRYAADSLGIGRSATDEQIKRLQEQAKVLTGSSLDKEHALAVLKLRDGTPLTQEERERALLLSEGFRKNAPIDYKESANDYRMTARSLLGLKQINGGYILTEQLSRPNSTALSQRLFGSPDPPADVQQLIDRMHKFHDADADGEWNDQQAKGLLAQRLFGRLHEINDWRREQYAKYMDGEHEKEAWGVGARAKFLAQMARERTADGAYPKQSAANDNTPRANDGFPAALYKTVLSSQTGLELGAVAGDISQVEELSAAVESPEGMTATDIPKMWQSQSDTSKLSPEERSELLQHIRTPLFNESTTEDFARFVIPVTADWKSLTEQRTHLVESTRRYKDALGKVHEMMVDGVIPIELKAHLQDSRVVQEALASKPEALRRYLEYVRAREDQGQDTKKLNESLNIAAQNAQAAINQFADAHGIPPVQVVHDGTIEASDGRYVRGKGTLKIAESKFYQNNTARFVGVAYHELTHSEQEYTMIRKIADDLGIGKDFTREDVDRLKYQASAHITKMKLSDERAEAILKTRAGQRLEPAEVERADVLIDSFNKAAPMGKDWVESGNDYRTTARLLHKLNDRSGGYQVAAQLAETGEPVLFKRIFGTEIPPTQVKDIIDQYQAHKLANGKTSEGPESQPGWNDALVSAQLTETLTQRLNDINRWREARHDQYRRHVPHEMEAWGVGSQATNLSKELAATTDNANSEPAQPTLTREETDFIFSELRNNAAQTDTSSPIGTGQSTETGEGQR